MKVTRVGTVCTQSLDSWFILKPCSSLDPLGFFFFTGFFFFFFLMGVLKVGQIFDHRHGS